MRKLNAKFVEAAKPRAERFDVLDSDVRGLALRVTPAGVKTWSFRYRRQSDGRRRNVTLGTYPEYRLEKARAWAAGLRASVARGDDPAGDKRARRLAETFGQVAVEWVWRHGRPNKARLTLGRDIRMLRRHILPTIGAMKAGEITKRDVIKLLDAVAAKPDARIACRSASNPDPHRRVTAPSLPALRCAARLQPWRCVTTT